MLKLIKIAVTGEIASGKSTACRFFKDLGAYVIDTDSLTHELLSSKSPIEKKIIKFLGLEVLTDGMLDREKIAKLVFNDIKKLKKIEKIIHPKIFTEITRQYREAKKKNVYSFFVVEMPLLFETHQEKFYDYLIVITAEKKLRMKRFKKDLGAREKRLMDIEKKTQMADFVINNNSSLAIFKRQINKIAKILIKT